MATAAGSASRADVRPRLRATLIQVATALVVVIADHLTKWLVSSRLPLGGEWPSGAPVVIHYVENRGAAFSLLPGAQWVFELVALAVAIYLIGWGYRLGLGAYRQVVLGLILGGAVSNAIDRVSQGYVVDFIDFRFWPVFNVADSCLVIGLALVIFTFRTRASHASGGE